MADSMTVAFNRKEQHRLKRDVLLKVAADCFNRKGFSGTSLKDVARELNITDAALYYYIRNKEELVTLCYERALDIGEQALQRGIAEGNDSLERLRLYIRYQIETICGDDGPVAILSEIPALSEAHREEILKRSRTHTRRVTKLLTEGIKDGSICCADATITSNALLGALNWIPKWRRSERGDTQQIVDGFLDTFTAGLAPR